jgi:hypothetical protein
MMGTTVRRDDWLGALARRLNAAATSLPTCVICGRGHAQTEWVVDSLGRIHGRCVGCVESDEPQHPHTATG